jgi:hypothetical protein
MRSEWGLENSDIAQMSVKKYREEMCAREDQKTIFISGKCYRY